MNPSKKENEKKVVKYDQITKGEYELHVLIESTSGLSLESDSSVDAKIAVTAFGKTEYTKVKSGVGVEETYWGEHIYFNAQFQNSMSAQNQRLLIAVYDFNKFSSNSLVGNYQIDIQRIYSQQNHTLKHNWLALSNIQRNYTEITGYVKISASLLGEKDTNIQLEVEPVASITQEKKVLIPPQIQRKTYQITVDVLEGKNLKPVDGSTVDSYLGIEFGQIYSVSETILKNCNPSYKTRVSVPMSLPAVVENIAFRLNDFNYFQKVEVLGSYYLNINELIKNYENPPPASDPTKIRSLVFENRPPLNQFRWVNFYGPQLNTSQDAQRNAQQIYPKLAAAYCGSVLMRVNIKENSRPQIKKQLLSPDEIKGFGLKKVGPPFVFCLTTKIVAAINLFDKARKYKIVVSVGSKEVSTKQAQAKNGFCFWSTELLFKVLVQPIQTFPDIFVYLTNDKSQRICYLRYKPKLGVIQQDQWVNMKPDTAMVSMQSEQGGYLKLSMELNQQMIMKEQSPIIREFSHPLADAYNLNKKNGQIVIDLLCGESILPLDTDGGIDAFFNFNYMQSEVSSSVKNDTLNPVYYERLIIESDIMDEKKCPPIIVNAYDKDKMSNQFFGSTFIDVGAAIKNKSLVYGLRSDPQPFWYELTQNGIMTGRFLISIRFLPDYMQKFPLEIKVEKTDYQVHLVIMGLRSLKNSGMLSVKQPFIQFDFAGLDTQKNTSKQFQESKMIKTEPMEKGRNVNISTVIPAKISLPTNYKYWPSLSAKVKDNVLGELYQPILGYFSINLQKAYLRSKQIKDQFQNRRKILLENKSRIVEKPPRLEGVNEGVLMNLRNFIMKSLNYNWQILDKGMEKQLMVAKPKEKINDDYVIIFPNYVKVSIGKTNKDGKEEERFKYEEKYKEIIEKNGNYMQVGFDDIKSRGNGISKRNKHYRYVLNEPFESYFERVYDHRLGIMDQIPIKLGRVFTSNDFMSNILRNVAQEDMVAGKYKGQLFISQYKEAKTQEEQKFKQQSQALLGALLKKGKVCMYLYIIEAANLPSKDSFSHSDPYLVVRGGRQKISYQKQYFNDDPNPQFLKKVFMILEFPEDSTVDIEVWDYDPIGGDELIGSATLDIEDRLQLKMSTVRLNSPIQTHNLTISTSRRSQGLVRFWVDLIPFEHRSLYRQFDIRSAPSQKFQVRIILWSVSEMPCDDPEDMSDLYVRCLFNQEIQQTDVHYRSSSGEGSFNWRMVFPVKLPMKSSLITFRVYDKDIVTSDDYLASASFDIKRYLEDAFQTNSSVTLMLGTEDLAKYSDVPGGKVRIIDGQPRYDRFQIETNNRSLERPATFQRQGKIQLSIQIMNEEQAKRSPVGKGRDNPNQYPYLPNPKGRFKFSLNPLTMAGQMCGPKMKKKIACIVCALLCLFIFIYAGITFGGALVGALLGRIVAG